MAQGLSSTTSSFTSLDDSLEAGTAIPTEEESQLRSDIQRTLAALGDLIQQGLSPAAEHSGKPQHVLLVKRYREILFDLSGDFSKASSTLNRKREQAELFRGASVSNNNASNKTDPAMEQLLRERNSIGNSLSASSAVIGQASEIHSDLKNQGSSLSSIKGTMAKMGNNIPGLNRLVDNIKKKRSKDDKILAGVIASCISFTLWYLFG